VGGMCCPNQMFAQHFAVYINFIKTEHILLELPLVTHPYI